MYLHFCEVHGAAMAWDPWAGPAADPADPHADGGGAGNGSRPERLRVPATLPSG